MICGDCDGKGYVPSKNNPFHLVPCWGCDGLGCRLILITKIKQPETGSIVLTHCKICQRSEIVFHGLAPRPERGDYWRLEGQCQNLAHTIAMGLKPIPLQTMEPCL